MSPHADQRTAARSPRGYSFLWLPGTGLMGSVQFPVKALIISVMFLLPVALLGYYFVTAQNA